MNKELYRPIQRGITALILIILIKFAAVLTLLGRVWFAPGPKRGFRII